MSRPQLNQDSGDILASEQAQAHLHVSRATFWNLIRRYNIPRYRIPLRGKRIFFKRSDLDKLREPVPVTYQKKRVRKVKGRPLRKG